MEGVKKAGACRPMMCARCKQYDAWADYCELYIWPEDGGYDSWEPDAKQEKGLCESEAE